MKESEEQRAKRRLRRARKKWSLGEARWVVTSHEPMVEICSGKFLFNRKKTWAAISQVFFIAGLQTNSISEEKMKFKYINFVVL